MFLIYKLGKKSPSLREWYFSDLALGWSRVLARDPTRSNNYASVDKRVIMLNIDIDDDANNIVEDTLIIYV